MLPKCYPKKITMETLQANKETVFIYFRNDFQKKDGCSKVYLRLYLDRKNRKDYFLFHVKPENWDSRRQRVKRSDSAAFMKNSMLETHLAKASKILSDLKLRQIVITTVEFENHFLANKEKKNCFVEFALNETEFDYKKKKGAYDTYRSRKSLFTRLGNFAGGKLPFSSLTIDFFNKLEADYISDGNSQSTISKKMKLIKIFINRAIEQGLVYENPLNKKKFKTPESKPRFLTIEELNKLEKVYRAKSTPENILNALKPFLFSCYTGLRYGDVKNLKFKNLVWVETEHGPKRGLALRMMKTKREINFILVNKAVDLLPPDDMAGLKVFKVYSNQAENRYLKMAADLAEIKKNISFHCARHTFATIGVSGGIGLPNIQSLMGHCKISTTQIYSKITDNSNINAMLMYNNIFEAGGSGAKQNR